jgi:hypothetical protein
VNKDGENLTTTRTITITITKEIEERMREHIEASGYGLTLATNEGHFIAASQLLELLGIESSEDFADAVLYELNENPPVHTCKPSYKMQQARIFNAILEGWNDMNKQESRPARKSMRTMIEELQEE